VGYGFAVRILAAVLISVGGLAVAPASAGALFRQCPPVGGNTGCQALITLEDGAASVRQDPTQPYYDFSDDSLVGVQNNTSEAVTALPLAAPRAFAFDGDGICNPSPGGNVALLPGCVPAPGSPPGTVCGREDGSCSYPRPPGQPPGHVEPGAPPGTTQNGYEGPDTWFSDVTPGGASGTVNFSPALEPGDSTYFGLEAPPSLVDLQVGAPAVTAPLFSTVARLAPAKKCVSRRKFRIHIRQPGGVKIRVARVFVNGKNVRVLKRRFFRKARRTATVNLRGLPRGKFRIRITIVTTKGLVIKATRTYHTCAEKPRRPKRPPTL
jgi:hypothetical protein